MDSTHIWIGIGWILSNLICIAIGLYMGRDKPPKPGSCNCYYDTDGVRTWPGDNCPVHRKVV